MAFRSECLYDGVKIGIESIFYIKDGKQINIPGKVEQLRRLGREKKLFCPCDNNCGANLVVVAGERMLKEQHFRLHPDSVDNNCCSYKAETAESIKNKMVIMGWLQELFSEIKIDTRVPISSIGDTDRKFELTFLCKDKNIALVYLHDSNYLNDAKLSCLDDNKNNLNIIYILDSSNMNATGQYPEYLMKIQDRQGYCLFLSYAKGTDIPLLTALFYFKDLEGRWRYHTLHWGRLYDFNFQGSFLFYKEDNLSWLLSTKKQEIDEWLCDESEKRRIEAEKQALEAQRERATRERQLYEEKKRLERIKRQQKEKLVIQEAKDKEAEEKERKILEARKQQLESMHLMVDNDGRRIYKCRECSFVGTADHFVTCGGRGKENEGLCDKCARRGR